MIAMGLVGSFTAFFAASIALAQFDVKKVLAYSTLSQLGYMVTAMGAGAYTAGLFHLFTHAFFKALLFLAAGAVIISLHHEQDIFRMGGLRRRMPVIFWTFLIGAASLVALPLVTAAGDLLREMATFQSAGVSERSDGPAPDEVRAAAGPDDQR